MPEPRKIDIYVSGNCCIIEEMYVCMYVAMCMCARAGPAESGISACYHTYIVLDGDEIR